MLSLSALMFSLVALSGILVSSHPTARDSLGTELQPSGEPPLSSALDSVYDPGEAGLELVQVGRSIDLAERASLAPRSVAGVASAIEPIIGFVTKGIAEDKIARERFTERFIQLVRQDHPEFNWVICHVAHRTEFDGNKDEHWGHRHQEFDVKIGGNIGYDIYWFMSGTFVRLGDPGYINWAYDGKVLSQTDSDKGTTVVFGTTDGLAPGRIPNSGKNDPTHPPRAFMIPVFLILAAFFTT
ncbi:hypothetical protein FA13DRAFT_1794209 [Coprinellus micaceus]|uniref:Uncharacterized protein n=1 Tax=Coprinellus micaceus TaxID=71717 RepID=A0A4Y7T266_COPMI|nr:hypothetical protein FA13DRAFT_1794209 [Coprinellus micaceus]